MNSVATVPHCVPLCSRNCLSCSVATAQEQGPPPSSIQRADSPLTEGTPPRCAARQPTGGVPSFPAACCPRLQCQRRRFRPRPLASMLHRRSQVSAADFFASMPQPQRPSQLVVSVVSPLRRALFLPLVRPPTRPFPPVLVLHLLPAATRLGTAHALLREIQCPGCPIKPQTFLLLLRLYWRGALYTLVAEVFDQMRHWGFRPQCLGPERRPRHPSQGRPSRNGSVRCAPGRRPITSPTPSCSLIAAGRGTQKRCSRDFNKPLLLSRLFLLAAVRLEPCPSFCSCLLSRLSLVASPPRPCGFV